MFILEFYPVKRDILFMRMRCVCVTFAVCVCVHIWLFVFFTAYVVYLEPIGRPYASLTYLARLGCQHHELAFSTAGIGSVWDAFAFQSLHGPIEK